MKFAPLLSIAMLVAFTIPAKAQKGMGLRKRSEQQGNYRVAVVEIPEEMTSEFERLKSKVFALSTDRDDPGETASRRYLARLWRRQAGH